jgi:NAD dependent epimerase/dehydratase family enzyme
LFLYAIENGEMNGVYNAVAPEPVSNKTFTLTLAKKMKLLFYIPFYVPVFILKIMLGGRSVEILRSAAVSCKKILAAGFSFQFKNIDTALEDIIRN